MAQPLVPTPTSSVTFSMMISEMVYRAVCSAEDLWHRIFK